MSHIWSRNWCPCCRCVALILQSARWIITKSWTHCFPIPYSERWVLDWCLRPAIWTQLRTVCERMPYMIMVPDSISKCCINAFLVVGRRLVGNATPFHPGAPKRTTWWSFWPAPHQAGFPARWVKFIFVQMDRWRRNESQNVFSACVPHSCPSDAVWLVWPN